jgi:dienelactone hydrolase
MEKISTLLLFLLCTLVSFAQVKSNYIYSTSMPYGTLDLRTKITSTYYYYLRENQTFAFRESSPGVRTNSYLDMTSWDSSPYTQGHLRLKNGTSDKFVLNYRLLKPNNYQSTYTEGYPLIVIMHGAVERGNCYYTSCYHSNFSYDPNVNYPAAPKTSTHKLLNNDHHVSIGGKQHLDARTLAGTKFPNDPTLAARAFQGFVLMPQMMNIWDSLNVQDVIKTVRLLQEKYKIDPNRIYIHGLSIGGYAVYQAIKRAPWLFAAALPMSAVTEAAYIFKHNQQNKVAHIPLWIFQGATDTNPTPSFTQNIVNKFKAAGGTPRYTVYSSTGHIVWNKAYAEADFFSWMKSKNKANLHAYKGITTIIKSKSQYPKLMLAEGFYLYQWEKNGVLISGAGSNTYTVTTPGTYRARFSRVSAPTSTQWNKWSAPITINETTTMMASAGDAEQVQIATEELLVSVYPNPTRSGNIHIRLQTPGDGEVRVQLLDQLGKTHFEDSLDDIQGEGDAELDVPASLTDGIYFLHVIHGQKRVIEKVVIRN